MKASEREEETNMSRENHASEAKPRFRIAWARHAVQIFALALFCTPLLTVGWQLAGLFPGSEDALPTPAELPFFGSLSSSTVAGVNVLDPFAQAGLEGCGSTRAAPCQNRSCRRRRDRIGACEHSFVRGRFTHKRR